MASYSAIFMQSSAAAAQGNNSLPIFHEAYCPSVHFFNCSYPEEEEDHG